MTKKSKISESDLYEPIKNYFISIGFEVHAEVNDCDIAAKKNDELVMIELKKSINIKLLVQAVKRQKITENVYIAIPKPNYSLRSKKWKDLCLLVRRLELGLIIVSLNTTKKYVKVIQKPSLFDRKKSMRMNRKKAKNINDEIMGRLNNKNTGGTSKTKIMTAYKENAIYIACCLNRYEKLSPAELRKIGTGKKTQSILYNNFYGWFTRVEKGVYSLSENGQNVLSEYPDIVAHYKNIID